jgi:tetratricopeptide (TPR) repeat protein
MIERKTIREIPSALRGNFQTAMTAAEKNNIDYAILLFKGIVQQVPGFVDARNELRKVEKAKLAKMGFMGKQMSSMKAAGIAAKGKSMVGKKPREAMNKAEDALALNLACLPALKLLAKAALEEDAAFIAIEALELAAELHPKDVNVLDQLAKVYADAGMGSKTLQVRQKISSMFPNDMQKQQDVRAAAALATMEEGNWEDKESDYRDKLRDKGQAVKSEQEERIVRSVDDVKDVIGELEEKISSGDDSLDNRRKLAELYQRGGNFDRAIEHYNVVVEKMGSLDPHIDQSIESCELSKLDGAIEEWRVYGDSDPANKEEAEQNIAAMEQQKLDYRRERAMERVRNYPNDTELRFQLAMVYWDMGDVGNALKEFQVAQKNPHRRLEALVYLGRCFYEKGQYDIAVEQFEKALEGMVAMNKDKMDAIYHLAITLEAVGKKEEALGRYKEIYQAKIDFRDVEERMAALSQGG